VAEIVLIKYRAFLSYGHKDTRWAKWLHTRLENFRIDKDLIGRDSPLGPVLKTQRPILRDGALLSATGAERELEQVRSQPSGAPMPSARRSGRALLLCKACFLRLLTGTLISSGRPSSRFRARNQAIVKPQSVEVFDGLGSPSQGLFLGLIKKLGALSVQFLDTLNCCFVCHPIFPVVRHASIMA
jgi:hypothetical protein